MRRLTFNLLTVCLAGCFAAPALAFAAYNHWRMLAMLVVVSVGFVGTSVVGWIVGRG